MLVIKDKVVFFSKPLYQLSSTGMLPQFSILQKMYLGNIDYGGVYSDLDVKQYLFKEPYKRNLPDNATCMLRMSALLNVTTKQPGSEQGLKNYYYFYDRDELLYYLKDMYGSPLKSNKTEVFRGQVGIMFIDTGSETNDDCSVLLWNGNGFHQGKGLIRHKNFQSAQLWAAPTGKWRILAKLQWGEGRGWEGGGRTKSSSFSPSKILGFLH